MSKAATKTRESEAGKAMWLKSQVMFTFTGPFAASIPKNTDEIQAMLEHRMASDPQFQKMVDPATLEELGATVAEEVGATPEEEKGWATFKKDEKGLYYESRCVKAHLKDCANIIQGILGIKGLKPKLANRVYVVPERIYVMGDDGIKQQADGSEIRFVHAMTPVGMRNSIKRIEYVTGASISFNLKVLNDGVITPEILNTVLEYGSTHGIGQERSMDWGKYTFEVYPA